MQITPYVKRIDSVQFIIFFLLNHHVGMLGKVTQDDDMLDGGYNSLKDGHETDMDHNVQLGTLRALRVADQIMVENGRGT